MKTTPKLFDRVHAQQPVGGKCQIAFVGEAPSTEERIYGFPLVGPAGRVLDQMLRTAGLSRPDEAYPVPFEARHARRLIQARAPYLVTNVFDEQLPGNSVKAWCAGAAERRGWESYELEKLGAEGYLRPEHVSHLVRLSEEIARARPNVIVPLGATALWAFTGRADITTARGTVSLAALVAPDVKIVPTFHPSYVVRDWSLFHTVVSDLERAAGEASSPELWMPDRRIHIRPTLRDLRDWEQIIIRADLLSIDIERGSEMTCIGFGVSPEDAYVIPFVDYEDPARNYWSSIEAELEALNMVERVLASPIPKVLQNGLYDQYVLVRERKLWINNYRHDTRLMHHALYPEAPKSLAYMGATHCKVGPWKQMRAKKAEKRDE